MKEFRVFIKYSTQRNMFYRDYTVTAEDRDEALARVLAFIWLNEHANKNRYLKLENYRVEE